MRKHRQRWPALRFQPLEQTASGFARERELIQIYQPALNYFHRTDAYRLERQGRIAAHAASIRTVTLGPGQVLDIELGLGQL